MHPSDLITAFDALVGRGWVGHAAAAQALMAADAAWVGGQRRRPGACGMELERLAQTYREFVVCYQPVLAQPRDGASESGDENAFSCGCCWIHDYRRLLLRDPDPTDCRRRRALAGVKLLARLSAVASERRPGRPRRSSFQDAASGQPRRRRQFFAIYGRGREDDLLA